MSSNRTNYATDTVLQPIRGISNFAALYGQTGTELNASVALGYARQDIILDEGSSANILQNNALVDFGVAESDWGEVHYVGIISGTGVLYYKVPLATPKEVGQDKDASFPAGSIVITEDVWVNPWE